MCQPPPLISGQANNTGYYGQTITINGSNFTSDIAGTASDVTFGGVNAASITYVNSTQITAVVPGTYTTGNIVITNPNNGTSIFTSFTNLGYISINTALQGYKVASTWLGGVIPPAASTVTINTPVRITATVVSNAPNSLILTSAGTLTLGASGTIGVTNALINNGSLIMQTGSELDLGSGATFTNASTFTSGGGLVAFQGTGTVSGIAGFSFVTIAGAVDFGTNTTINGSLEIDAGGSVTNAAHAPTYSLSSILIYNTNVTVGNEWTPGAVSGAGVPNDVQIGNGATTTLTLPNASYTATGNFVFSSNASFVMNASGGTLNVGGDWTNNTTNSANFTKGGGTIKFNGSIGQNIDGTNTNAGGFAFNSLNISNSSGISAGVTLGVPITVSGILTLSNGVLNTDITDIVSVTNTSSTAISGGNTGSFVDGPIKWALPSSLSSGSSYIFPVGNTSYLPFALVNPTTGNWFSYCAGISC